MIVSGLGIDQPGKKISQIKSLIDDDDDDDKKVSDH